MELTVSEMKNVDMCIRRRDVKRKRCFPYSDSDDDGEVVVQQGVGRRSFSHIRKGANKTPKILCTNSEYQLTQCGKYAGRDLFLDSSALSESTISIESDDSLEEILDESLATKLRGTRLTKSTSQLCGTLAHRTTLAAKFPPQPLANRPAPPQIRCEKSITEIFSARNEIPKIISSQAKRIDTASLGKTGSASNDTLLPAVNSRKELRPDTIIDIEEQTSQSELLVKETKSLSNTELNVETDLLPKVLETIENCPGVLAESVSIFCMPHLSNNCHYYAEDIADDDSDEVTSQSHHPIPRQARPPSAESMIRLSIENLLALSPTNMYPVLPKLRSILNHLKELVGMERS